MQPYRSLLSSLLLAGATVVGFASTHPTQVGGHVQSRYSAPNVLEERSLSLEVVKIPEQPANCPETNNGNFGNYPAQTYTTNQIKAAFLGGAQLAARGKKLGDNEYPHDFGNGEKLPFDCGTQKMEFIIQEDGKVYNGGDTGALPDRVVFEYRETNTKFIVKYCGAMRHGPTRDFLACPN